MLIQSRTTLVEFSLSEKEFTVTFTPASNVGTITIGTVEGRMSSPISRNDFKKLSEFLCDVQAELSTWPVVEPEPEPEPDPPLLVPEPDPLPEDPEPEPEDPESEPELPV